MRCACTAEAGKVGLAHDVRDVYLELRKDALKMH